MYTDEDNFSTSMSSLRRYGHQDGVHESDDVSILFVLLRFSRSLFSKGLEYMKSITHQLVAFIICLLLIPLVIFISVFAGWFVWKTVAVGWDAPVYLQYGDGTPPYAEIYLPTLVSQQAYEISLHLIIPATESNFALGNFMTTLTLSTPSNKTLASIRRPAIALPYSSSFWFSRPTVVDLEVPLLSSFAPGTSRVVAKLELGRKDGWKSLGEGHGRELSVLTASLHGVVKLEGLRGIVTRFPVVSALVSSVIFLGLSLLVLAAMFLPAMLQSSTPHDTSQSGQIDGPPPPGFLPKSATYSSSDSDIDDEKPWRRRRKSRMNTDTASWEGGASASSSRSRPSSDKGIKTEATSTIIPEASGSSSPLRRRRSRLSQDLSDNEMP